MKKNFILFAFFLLISFALTDKSTFAQEITQEPTLTPKPTAVPVIKYDLPYPGILPDHRLYKVKVLRDRISNMLISDPNKKINFYLLQTDKGILATAMLVDKNKIGLAEQTALKAEHNFTLISNNFKSRYNFDQTDKNTTKDLIKKLRTASQKHQEVLNSLIKRVPKDRQKTFKTVIEFSKRNMSEIEKTIKEYESDKNKLKN